tara:strand:+ start:5093 stop:6091 length:999 start_codon:yes stop_codon:yes gene_type:complete
MILVTGSAGFIGFAVSKKLLNLGYEVVGYDNLNDYYDVKLKKSRIKELQRLSKKLKINFVFFKKDLNDKRSLNKIFKKYKINKVINLAAQAGVRYSIKNPEAYLHSNISGFLNILELSKKFKIKHLVFASTSSVYGDSKRIPFKESDRNINPIQFYSSTKMSNEIMAYSYSSLFKIPITGMRIFTAYGPWGRPDMALFKFTKNIIEKKPIEIFNRGNHKRDFTYIDDVAEYVVRIINKIPKKDKYLVPYNILNVASGKWTNLMTLITLIEKNLNMKAIQVFKNLQPGDIKQTLADTKKIKKLTQYKPKTPIKVGVSKFIKWYLNYYSKSNRK